MSTKTISSRCSFICIFFLLFFGFNISSVYSQDLNARQVSTDSRRMIVLKRRLEQERAKSVTNHKMFKVLQNHRGSEFELTKKCSQCHTNVSNHIHQVAIWNDDSSLNPDLSVSNVKSQCLSCHKEYSSNKDDVRAFTKNSTLSNFACMGCHSVSNDLKHGDFGPKKDNCGTCHFLNNSSNLDISLLAPDRNLDVHMSKSGGDFSCQVCHRNLKHNRGYKEGHKYFKKFMDIKLNRVGAWIEELNEKCSSCHTSSPHLNNPKLNDHTDVIGCQTCHIPYVGRSKHGTILKVDWSNKENGSFGAKTLRGQNIVPDYFWHKGVFISRKFNKVIDVNNSEKGQISFLSPDGKYKRDRGSKILPFLKRVFIVAQDVKHPNLLYPKISVNDKKWDMDKFLKRGADELNLPYSGQYRWVTGYKLMPVNHMVTKNALSCINCHISTGGRLEQISKEGEVSLYIPGQRENILDIIGIVLVILTFLGVSVHGLGRFVFSKLRGRSK